MTNNPQTAETALPRRVLGLNHLSVGSIGLGCMTMTWAYGSRDRAESIATIRRAMELGVTLFDTADIERSTSFPKEDFRSILPRFRVEALSTNLRIVDGIKAVASRHQAAPAQIALAWVLAQGEQIVPIPGSSKRSHLEQSVEAASIRLTSEDLAELDALPHRSVRAINW